VTLQQIKQFYKAYKQQVLDEMQEYYDAPLQHIERIEYNKWIAYENNIKVNFVFMRRFGNDLYKLPNIIDKNQIKEYYERSWSWDETTPENERNAKNFLRVIGTSFKITQQFFQDKPNCKILLFTSLTKGHNSIYSNPSRYSKKLISILGDQYHYISDPDNFRYWIINKDVINYKNQNHINIRMEMLGENMDEAIKYWYYPLKYSSTSLNVKIKAKIKQKILREIYIK